MSLIERIKCVRTALNYLARVDPMEVWRYGNLHYPWFMAKHMWCAAFGG